MKLVTFQSYEALKSLINKGYLECDPSYLDLNKVGPTYNWVSEKMKCIDNPYQAKYPIWAWVRCYNNICPPKHKGDPIKGFDVKITFNKEAKDVFIMDIRRYAFMLDNTFIPSSLTEKKAFDKLLEIKGITKEELEAYVRHDKYESHRMDNDYLAVCNKIKESFDKCITSESDVLQGCVWRIDLTDVEKIEIINDPEYKHGSINYVRSNGKRMDWKEDFYKMLK